MKLFSLSLGPFSFQRQCSHNLYLYSINEEVFISGFIPILITRENTFAKRFYQADKSRQRRNRDTVQWNYFPSNFRFSVKKLESLLSCLKSEALIEKS
jgi:hypothetical protein